MPDTIPPRLAAAPRVALMATAELARLAAPPLAVIGFGGLPKLPDATARLALPIPVIAPDRPMVEVWTAGSAPVTIRHAAGLRLAQAGDCIFGTLALQEDAPLEALARRAYETIFAAMAEAGCPTLLRVSHFLPRITADAGGHPRYWRFNAGRRAAFEARRHTLETAPAASALGIGGDTLFLHFIACAAPCRRIENPRQVSAWRYPERYGPAAPVFSRAVLANPGVAPMLLVSGTASIVDHESRHPGDVAAQTDETARNLLALLAECRRLGGEPGEPTLKAYLRHEQDAPVVRARLQAAGLPEPALMLRAEVCRDELLVEVELFAEA